MHASPLRRVVWNEGLLVEPQHFQQADRYHDHSLDFRVRPLAAYPWGVVELAVGPDHFDKSGTFQLERFQGVLPDGTIVAISATDTPRIQRVIGPADLPESGRLELYLALPVEQLGGCNYSGSPCHPHAHQGRYTPEPVSLVDETSGANPQPIALARPNVMLLFANELTDAVERIKIAEVIGDSLGRLVLDRSYVPPCLVLGSADALLLRLDQLLHLMQSRRAVLAARHGHNGGVSTPGALEALWLLSVLGGATALLHHLRQTAQIHPEVVYRSLLELAGQLTALRLYDHQRPLPTYDHHNLKHCFAAVCQLIEEQLRIIDAPLAITLPLDAVRSIADYSVYRTAQPFDVRLLDGHVFYLIVEVIAPDSLCLDELVHNLPNLIIVGAFEQIDKHIRYMAGLRLHPTPPLPELLLRPHTFAFRLAHEELLWETIARARQPAIYLAPEIQHRVRVELVALVHEHAEPALHPRHSPYEPI